MKEKTKNKSIIAVVTLLIIIVLTGVFLLIPKTYSADVGANEIAPNITTRGDGVTVYVNGKDVVKPNPASDNWYAKPGSKITVTIINETMILEPAPAGSTEEAYPVTLTCTTGAGAPVVTKYNSSWFTYTLPDNTTDQINIEISVKTIAPTAKDKGKYFGNPYLISNGESVTALSLIFDDKGTDEHYARFNVTAETWKETLTHAYFRLTTNILISNPLFTGIGNSANPFQGCFDFNGYTASLKIVKTEILDTDFRPFDGSAPGATGAADGETTGATDNPSSNPSPNKPMVAYGFFSYIYGDGENPCLIRNANVSGSIAVNIYDADKANETSENIIMAGGVAGVIGKNVQLDEIYSEVSVSVLADNESLYVGGVFGFCSSSISSWCNAKYGGSYSNVSGITHNNASAFVGGFAGFMQNAYVKSFVVDANQCTIIANSLGGNTGVAIASGFVGAVYMKETTLTMVSQLRPLSIDNIKINVNNSVEIVSVTDSTPRLDESGNEVNDQIDPDNMANHSFAISSGFIGTIYCIVPESTDLAFDLGDISFVNNAARAEGSDTINITAQTNDLDCYGAVFAGGLIGYVRVNASKVLTVDFNKVLSDHNNEYTLFNCSANISAIQNGKGPAYAGGFFGYRAFKFQDFTTTTNADGSIKLPKLHLCESMYRVDILARQSPTSSIGVNNAPYECLAGYFTSKLPEGYSFSNCEFVVPNGSVSAERNVGSTAIGEIAAGGFAGIVSGRNSRECFKQSGDIDGTLSNIKMNFSHNVEIKACCYSYKSSLDNITTEAGAVDTAKKEANKYFNNVYAGGFAGLAADYLSINNINVDFNGGSTGAYATYSVYGVQNGVSGNDDLVTEGFIGGMFGLLLDTPCSDSILNGEAKLKSRVYFESTASPNTASVGGIAGAAWSLFHKVTLLKDATVQNIRVIGKAYSDKASQNNQDYDLYVGGAVGVAGTKTNSPAYDHKYHDHGLTEEMYTYTHNGIVVNDCIVEAIGENKMLTYAGGVFGGVWYNFLQTMQNCVVQRSLIQASSVSSDAYAGGIVGLMQNAALYDSIVLASVVSTETKDGKASSASAGIFARNKNGFYLALESCSSSARVSAVGATQKIAGIGGDGSSTDSYFVNERAQTNMQWYDAPNNNYTGNLHLADKTDATEEPHYTNDLTLQVGESCQVYPHLRTDSRSVHLRVADGAIATLDSSSNTITAVSPGVTYVYAYMTIKGKEYILCSYPVKVGTVADRKFQGLIYERDDTTKFKESTDTNPTAYKKANYSYTTGEGENAKTTIYDYFVLNVGQDDTVFNKVNIFPEVDNAKGTFLTGFKLYSVNPQSITAAADNYNERIAQILNKKATTESAITLGNLNGRISVLYDFSDNGRLKKMSMKAYQILRYHEIVIAEYTEGDKTYGVIVEFRPNQVTDMTVTPSSSTSPLDTIPIKDSEGNVIETQYVFAPGDIVRFDVVFERVYQTYGHYAVKVRFTDENGALPNWIRPNGTIYIPANGFEQQYKVKCEAIDYPELTKTITILVREKVGFEFKLGGADVNSDRELLANTYFQFTTTPHPGYGMRPDFSITAVYSNGTNGTLMTNPDIAWSDPDANGKGTITINTLTWTDSEGAVQNCTIDYTKGSRGQENEYTYQFYLPKETINAILSSTSADGSNIKTVVFGIDYEKTYYMAFISDYGDNPHYFFMVPVNHRVGKDDELVSYDPLKEWSEKIDTNRPGYDMRGFYLTRNADSLSGYGASFKDMAAGNETVSGALRFYARWTYNISVAAPDGVTVESGFAADMVEPGTIVPVDDKKGFSFVIKTPSNWEGTPRFSVYVVKNKTNADGAVTQELVEITKLFKPNAFKNGYAIDADILSEHCKDYGYIYLNVYADSLDFFVGDVDVYDTHNMYSDGVFTLEYSLNRVDETTDNITFNFNQLLPAKTSARLYYRKNGVTVWSGGCVLSAPKNALSISNFTNMNGLGNIDRSGIASEKFILVVTLPNNRENFIFDSNSLKATISVKGYKFTPKIMHDSGSGNMLLDHERDVFDVPDNKEDVTLYKPLLRKVTLSDDKTQVTFSIIPNAAAPADLVDYRHQSSEYVWAVEKTDDSVIGTTELDAFKSAAANAGWTKTAETVLGVYYIAEKGTFDISSMSLPNGYKLTLIEVINVRQPSEGLRLFEIKKDASGNLTLINQLYISITPEKTETPTNPTT